jgi:hypothetical protein
MELIRKFKCTELFLILVLFSPLMLFIYIFPKDLVGWILSLVPYLLIAYSKTLRKNKNMIIVTFIGLTIHQIIAFTNAFIKTTLGADGDAQMFHNSAVMLITMQIPLNFVQGSDFYTNFLAFFYKIFGESLFLGEQLSMIAVTISVIYLIKIYDEFIHQRFIPGIVILYLLLPTCFLYTSITLREAWEMLFLSTSIFYGLKLKGSYNFGNILKILISSFLLSLWHNGLLVFNVIFLFITFYSISKRLSYKILFIMFIPFMVIGFLYLQKMGFTSQATDAFTSGNGLTYTQQYRSNNLDSRASYGLSLDSTTNIGLSKSLPLIFLSYMFAPFPWQIGNKMDIYACFESFLRFLLVYNAIKTWCVSKRDKTKKDERAYYSYLLTVYFCLEILWALGTSNWGTAMRHHLIGYSLLLAVGGQRFLNSLNRMMKSVVR